MKLLKYNFLQDTDFCGVPVFIEKTLEWNEKNEEIARCEAYNGEYVISDDGETEETIAPTVPQRVEALELAMLEMMGVTLQ